jgi:D-methionine transport system ATP-binding protein
MPPLSITTTQLCKSVPHGDGVRAILSDVSLNIRVSSITALIGRSGAGKSTLLRCLNGLDTIDSGEISITPKSETQQRLDAAMIFQAYTLVSRKTVLQNVCLPITLQGTTLTDTHTKKATQLLAEVGLSDKANSYPSELSGGQRQRVAIARALMLDPGLLLCDELTSALDPKTTIEILALLKRVNKDHGVTIVLVTHDMDVVKEVADTVCVMDDGYIVEQGSVIDVLIKPKHSVTRQLIDATTAGALPAFISDRIQTIQAPNADVVLRLIFTEESSTKPIIAAVATTFNVCFSIIAGSLDNLSDQQKNHMFGHLWVSCTPNEKFDAAICYMTDHGVGVETLGYIVW